MFALFRAALALLSFALLCLWTPLSLGHGAETDFEEDVEAMYLAYYGRPGDPAGVEFWADQLQQSEGDLSAIIDAFGSSEEYSQRYSGLSDEQLVDNLFQQLFGDGIDIGGSFIQDNEIGFSKHSTHKGDELFLPQADPVSGAVYLGIQSLIESF